MSAEIHVTQPVSEPRWRLDISRWATGDSPPDSTDAAAQLFVVVDEFSTSTADDIEDLLSQVAGWIVAGADKPVQVQLRKTVDSTGVAFNGNNL